MAYPANIAVIFGPSGGPDKTGDLDTNFANLQQGLNSLGNGTGLLQIMTANASIIQTANIGIINSPTINGPSSFGGGNINIYNGFAAAVWNTSNLTIVQLINTGAGNVAAGKIAFSDTANQATIPNANDTLVARNTQDTLQGKTFGNVTFSGVSNFTGNTAVFSGVTNFGSNATIDTTGRARLPGQPLFFADHTSNTPNITGAGNDFIVVFDSAIVNQGNNYNASNGVFTMPITGNMLFTNTIRWDHNGNATRFDTKLVVTGTNARTVVLSTQGTGASPGAGIGMTGAAAVVVPMAPNDTAKIVINASGGANSTGIYGVGGPISYFSGTMLAG